MKIPTTPLPEPGYYYHYKHDPAGAVNNYCYRVLGTGLHTEDDCDPRDAAMVVYLPLYEDVPAYEAGKLFACARWNSLWRWWLCPALMLWVV